MKNNRQQIEKTRNIWNILLPDWTQDENPQEVNGVPCFLKNTEQNAKNMEQIVKNTEQLPETAPVTEIPVWVKIVEKWTPQMTVLAWPKISQIIDQYGEESAAAWVCEQSPKFFKKHLTSNVI